MWIAPIYQLMIMLTCGLSLLHGNIILLHFRIIKLRVNVYKCHVHIMNMLNVTSYVDIQLLYHFDMGGRNVTI